MHHCHLAIIKMRDGSCGINHQEKQNKSKTAKPLSPELLAITFGNHLYISVLSANITTFSPFGKNQSPIFAYLNIFL